MTLRGMIDGGKLVLEDGSRLPNGTFVDVHVRTLRGKVTKVGRDPLSRLARHAVATGIPDLADQHDHYAYGTPKRSTKRVKAFKSARKSA